MTEEKRLWRAHGSKGDMEHLCEGERDRDTGLPTALQDALSHAISRVLIRALPATDSGFPYFCQMQGHCKGRLSEFILGDKRYEVAVLREGDLKLLRATAAAYLVANGDDGVLEDVEAATLERLAGKTLAELQEG